MSDFWADTIRVYFHSALLLSTVISCKSWRSKLSGLRFSPLHRSKRSKQLSAHLLMGLDKKFFLYSCDLDLSGQAGEREGFRSRPGIGTHASHILHIIGSFGWS